MTETIDAATAYRGIRERVTELACGMGDVTARRLVPATPAWDVHDLIAHIVGVAADSLDGRLDGVATEPWTAAQVEARKGRTVDELLDEWAERGPRLEQLMEGNARGFGQLIFDAVTHEHDLRGALGRQGAHDTDAVRLATGWVASGFRRRLTGSDFPALRVVIDGDERVAGDGEPEGELHLSTFEALRAFAGRRSAAQLRKLDWGGDPERWLPAFTYGPFTPAADDLDDHGDNRA